MLNGCSASQPASANVTSPLAGAVHEYQTDAPVVDPGSNASPGSRVAAIVVPSTVTADPERITRSAKRSLARRVVLESSNWTSPDARPTPSTAIWYVVPATQSNISAPLPEATLVSVSNELPR